MNKIRIKHFGPIQEGYQENEGWLEVKKITIFIGNQGSGKSTVAKLISTMLWIEKAMVMGIVGQDELNKNSRFLKQLAYQRIDKYITESTVIQYIGQAFCFDFSEGIFTTTKSNANYLLPKIMYVPAERNFLSVVDRPDKLKNLPGTLYTFNDEFDAAKNKFAEGITLPMNQLKFEYDRLNKIAHISDKNSRFKLRLSEASSGFQSTVPLYLVSKYLSNRLVTEEDLSVQKNSLEDQKKMEKEVKTIMEDPLLTPEVRQAYLRQLSAKRKPVCFVNIVEEPEQNLFPSSQREILYSLLTFNRIHEGNKLIITTHSPYLINYLSIAIQAAYLRNYIVESGKKELLTKLFSIIDENAQVKADEVAIYELDEHQGTISILPSPYGIPSDKNQLNQFLRVGNEIFDSLLELEEEI